MAVKDLIINDDIEIANGDFDLQDSDAQHIEHILTAKPGQFYQWPTLGVGIEDNIKGSINRQALKQKIKQNLEADNYRVNKLEVSGGVDEIITSIDATRTK